MMHEGQKALLSATLWLVAFVAVGMALPHEVHYPTNATFFVAYGPDGTVHRGVTETNQVTVSGQPSFIAATNTLELAEEGANAGFTNWPALPPVGSEVARGVYVYSNQVVAVYQDHTRQVDWKVDSTPALYGIYRGAGTEIAEWVQPTGAHDAYQTGDKVLFNGSTYESLINANVWSPAVYPQGWKKI